MKHRTLIDSTPDGNLARCETCGDRAREFTGYGPAMLWCDQHERRSAGGLLNAGPRPSLRTLERQYRENATNLVYEPEERAQWKMLADEIREEIAARNPGPMPGQMELWTKAEGEQA